MNLCALWQSKNEPNPMSLHAELRIKNAEVVTTPTLIIQTYISNSIKQYQSANTKSASTYFFVNVSYVNGRSM